MSTEKALSGSVKALGALLAIGLVAAAFVLGGQFKNFRQPGTITVKGLAEQNFQSDRARWNTAVSVHGASYQEVLDRLNRQRPKLEQFLRSQGFDVAEIQTAAPEISPAFLVERDAHGNEIRTPNGYDGKQQLTVASSKLDRIQSAHQNILTLRAGNDAIDFEAPQYLLGNLEAIKHSLIKQATKMPAAVPTNSPPPAAARSAPCAPLRKARSTSTPIAAAAATTNTAAATTKPPSANKCD